MQDLLWLNLQDLESRLAKEKNAKDDWIAQQQKERIKREEEEKRKIEQLADNMKAANKCSVCGIQQHDIKCNQYNKVYGIRKSALYTLQVIYENMKHTLFKHKQDGIHYNYTLILIEDTNQESHQTIDSYWCCGAICFGRLLINRTAKYTVFVCNDIITKYAVDRMNGYNSCKLDKYQMNFEYYEKLLIYGYCKIHSLLNTNNDSIQMITKYYSTKIKSFHSVETMKNKYISFDEKTQRIKQIEWKNRNRAKYIAAYSELILQRKEIYYALIKVIKVGYKNGNNGFHIGIIPEIFGNDHYLEKPIGSYGNCCVYSTKSIYHYGGRYIWCRNYEYNAGDTIKCIIDLKLGIICFANLNRPKQEAQAFRINKYINYRFFVATLHQNDEYQLIA